MKLIKHADLRPYNTLQISARAKILCVLETESEIAQIFNHPEYDANLVHILGEGSNTLFTKNINSFVVHPAFSGFSVDKESESTITLQISAGQSWPDLVDAMVDKGWGGIENLTHIPGAVGAAPVQNVAAYGQNFSDVFIKLHAVDLKNGSEHQFSKADCQFGYRDSIFKHQPNRYLITKVWLKLNKHPQFETSYYSIGGRYDSLKSELATITKPPYTLKDIATAVRQIRTRKLPDWTKTPTIGSFFINPLITKSHLVDLQTKIPDLQFYPADNLSYTHLDDSSFKDADYVKVPVGRLLDSLGWGDKPIGHCSTYNNWASIITHNGQATGQELLEYSQSMAKSIKQAYNIDLQSEVTIIT